jgi:hypothetical protein
VPDIMGGTSLCLSGPVLDPSLVKSVDVWGPCDLTAEGRVIGSPMFSVGIIGLAFPVLRELCIGEPLLDIYWMSGKMFCCSGWMVEVR